MTTRKETTGAPSGSLHPIQGVKWVVLDLDDTLIQTTQAQVEARRNLAEFLEEKTSCRFLEGGLLSALEAIIAYFGTGNEWEFLRALCFEGGERGEALEKTVQEVTEYYRDRFFSFLRPFPGCEALLGDLAAQGLLLGIISNGLEDLQKLKLDHTGLIRYFTDPDQILVSSSFGPAADKPRQIMYQHFLRKNNCLPCEILFVGDKLSDIVGANLAGMVSGWVLQGRSERYRDEELRPRLRMEKADHVIREIGDLSDLVRGLGPS